MLSNITNYIAVYAKHIFRRETTNIFQYNVYTVHTHSHILDSALSRNSKRLCMKIAFMSIVNFSKCLGFNQILLWKRYYNEENDVQLCVCTMNYPIQSNMYSCSERAQTLHFNRKSLLNCESLHHGWLCVNHNFSLVCLCEFDISPHLNAVLP